MCSAPWWVNKQLVEKTDYLVKGSFSLWQFPASLRGCSLNAPCRDRGTAETKVVFNVVYLQSLNVKDFQCVAKAISQGSG